MDLVWICEFLFLYFQCFNTSVINTQELVTEIRFLGEDNVNISCWNTSLIQIQSIDVHEDKTPCRKTPCVLNSQDTQTIDNCNGQNSCLVDNNFTSTCLREFRYINLSYICKHENRTSVNTFEEDYGDWVNVSSNEFKWTRSTFLVDHTNIVSEGSRGYSIIAITYGGKTGKAQINTDNEFREPICLSLWYQLYNNCYNCSFSIYKVYDGNQTLLFTTDSKSSSLGQWKNISVDLYDQVPFKVTLEADLKYSNSTATRAILVDDTSIAYRHCQGQNIDTNCRDINTPLTIECETQFLAGNITLTFQQENLTIHQTNCRENNSVESELNTFCRTFNKSDQCGFKVLDFMNKCDDFIVFSKNISVTYQCIDIPEGYLESTVQYDMIGIALGVSGGLILIIITVVVICRIKRSKPGKQEASSSNKAFDELQYDDESQQKPTFSESSSQDKITPTILNLNISEQLDQDGQESADLYNISNEDGTYDVSSNDRQRGNPNDNNIYSHTADNIYDSGSHHKLPDRNEETYDHFFRQQTEDEYDTTART